MYLSFTLSFIVSFTHIRTRTHTHTHTFFLLFLSHFFLSLSLSLSLSHTDTNYVCFIYSFFHYLFHTHSHTHTHTSHTRTKKFTLSCARKIAFDANRIPNLPFNKTYFSRTWVRKEIAFHLLKMVVPLSRSVLVLLSIGVLPLLALRGQLEFGPHFHPGLPHPRGFHPEFPHRSLEAYVRQLRLDRRELIR